MNTDHPERLAIAWKRIGRPCALLIIGIVLLACASGSEVLKPPEARDTHHYCLPDSAIKYRGRAAEQGSLARPAPKTGSCRHQ